MLFIGYVYHQFRLLNTQGGYILVKLLLLHMTYIFYKYKGGRGGA